MSKNTQDQRVYKIGTRGSLLALTQCRQAKEELEKLTGASFELEIIKTQGDQQTSKPLWQLEGKDFFTKELDEALLTKKVDFVVHSYKDLGSERPHGLQLAAITERDYAQDIFLIPAHVKEHLQNKEWDGPFIVGSSSPRRMTNVESSLAEFLPTEKHLTVETKTLRGNVNTRIQKLKDGQYHGIVLAMAGLERLAKDTEARKQLRELLLGLEFTLLPQNTFPSAASQGALAIECREGDEEILGLLSSINHQDTIDEIRRERKVFREYGGGCHLAVGIHVRKMGPHFIHHQRGKTEEKRVDIHETENEKPIKEIPPPAFIGMPDNSISDDLVYDEIIEKQPLAGEHPLIAPENQLFITTRYALSRLPQETSNYVLWSAGTQTWKKLARAGHWVHGSSEGLGHGEIRRLTSSAIVRLFLEIKKKKEKIAVLSHEKGESPIGPVVPSYKRTLHSPDEEFSSRIKKCQSFYWTSAHQAQTYLEHFPEIESRRHFCGFGKTYSKLKDKGLNPTPLSSPKEFKNLIQQPRS